MGLDQELEILITEGVLVWNIVCESSHPETPHLHKVPPSILIKKSIYGKGRL